MKLNEPELRLPNWEPGVPFTLADGQVWQLRRPKVAVKVVFRDDGTTRNIATTSLGPEFHNAMVIFKSDDDPLLGALLLGIAMLRANYNLTGEQAADLLPWVPEDEANKEHWEGIIDAAVGNAPKPSPGG
jgi:hypothetical protein